MNKVFLIGRLTKDPVTRSNSSTTIVSFTIAVDRKYKNEGQPAADFPNCVAFGKTAEFIEKYFSKGKKIVIEGRIQTGSYENKEGNKVFTTTVVAESVEFGESKKESGEATRGVSVDADGFMNIPDGMEEDLPFA